MQLYEQEQILKNSSNLKFLSTVCVTIYMLLLLHLFKGNITLAKLFTGFLALLLLWPILKYLCLTKIKPLATSIFHLNVQDLQKKLTLATFGFDKTKGLKRSRFAKLRLYLYSIKGYLNILYALYLNVRLSKKHNNSPFLANFLKENHQDFETVPSASISKALRTSKGVEGVVSPLIQAQALDHALYRPYIYRDTTPKNLLDFDTSKFNQVYFGRGFEFTPKHTRALHTLLEKGLVPLGNFGHGCAEIHNLEESKDVFVNSSDLKGHTIIFGTTGSGKTRFFDLLITQAIMRDEVVVVIDPKGDFDLKNKALKASNLYKRRKSFKVIDLNDLSLCNTSFDLLGTSSSPTQIADKLCSLMSSSPLKSDPFVNYANEAILGAVISILYQNQKVTLASIKDNINLNAYFKAIVTHLIDITTAYGSKSIAIYLERVLKGIGFSTKDFDAFNDLLKAPDEDLLDAVLGDGVDDCDPDDIESENGYASTDEQASLNKKARTQTKDSLDDTDGIFDNEKSSKASKSAQKSRTTKAKSTTSSKTSSKSTSKATSKNTRTKAQSSDDTETLDYLTPSTPYTGKKDDVAVDMQQIQKEVELANRLREELLKIEQDNSKDGALDNTRSDDAINSDAQDQNTPCDNTKAAKRTGKAVKAKDTAKAKTTTEKPPKRKVMPPLSPFRLCENSLTIDFDSYPMSDSNLDSNTGIFDDHSFEGNPLDDSLKAKTTSVNNNLTDSKLKNTASKQEKQSQSPQVSDNAQCNYVKESSLVLSSNNFKAPSIKATGEKNNAPTSISECLNTASFDHNEKTVNSNINGKISVAKGKLDNRVNSPFEVVEAIDTDANIATDANYEDHLKQDGLKAEATQTDISTLQTLILAEQTTSTNEEEEEEEEIDTIYEDANLDTDKSSSKRSSKKAKNIKAQKADTNGYNDTDIKAKGSKGKALNLSNKVALLLEYYEYFLKKTSLNRESELMLLFSLCRKEEGFFTKVTGGINPILNTLCLGGLDHVLSSQDPKSSIDMIYRKNEVLYCALHALKDNTKSTYVGKLLLSDLGAFAGSIYSKNNHDAQALKEQIQGHDPHESSVDEHDEYDDNDEKFNHDLTDFMQDQKDEGSKQSVLKNGKKAKGHKDSLKDSNLVNTEGCLENLFFEYDKTADSNDSNLHAKPSQKQQSQDGKEHKTQANPSADTVNNNTVSNDTVNNTLNPDKAKGNLEGSDNTPSTRVKAKDNTTTDSNKLNRKVNLFIDEASEVVNEALIQLLNKSRGANFSITIATQTFADLAKRCGSRDAAMQVIGNCNNMVSLRIKDEETAKVITSTLPSTSYLNKSFNLTDSGNSAHTSITDSHSIGARAQDGPLFPNSALMLLPDFEYVAKFSDGRFIKGVIPILDTQEPQVTSKVQENKAQDLPKSQAS